MAIDKPLRQITLDDIYALVDPDSSVTESDTLDYKAVLPLKPLDKAKEEEKAAIRETGRLAGHVAAFANAVGGDLVLGVHDSKTEFAGADRVVGVEVDDLEHTLHDTRVHLETQCDPPIKDFEMHSILVPETGRYVFVLRVPASRALHRSKADKGEKGDPGYYVKRRSGDESPKLTMHEITEAIMARETVYEQVRRHRLDRDEYYQGLIGRRVYDTVISRIGPDGWYTPFFVVHLLPSNGFGIRSRDVVLRADAKGALEPLSALTRWAPHRKDLEGFLAMAHASDPHLYMQARYKCFRNGASEFMFSSAQPTRIVRPDMIFRTAIAGAAMIRIARGLDVGRELFLGISLHSLSGNVLATSEPSFGNSTIGDPLVACPLVDVSDIKAETEAVHEALLDAGDLLWQAAGHEGYREFIKNQSEPWPWSQTGLF